MLNKSMLFKSSFAPNPFGSPMDGRVFSGEKYRFGFNGKEKDDELKGDGNSLDFGARIYDSRLGRWLSCDPSEKKYPYQSTYIFSNNSPISVRDIDGKDGVYYIEGNTMYITSNIYFASNADGINVTEDRVKQVQNKVNDRIKTAESKGENTVNIDGKNYTVILKVNYIYVDGNIDDATNKANEDIANGTVDAKSINTAGVYSDSYVEGKGGKEAGHVISNYKAIAFSKRSFSYFAESAYQGIMDETLHTIGMDHKPKDVESDPNFGAYGNREFNAYNPTKKDFDQIINRGGQKKEKGTYYGKDAIICTPVLQEQTLGRPK